MHLRSLGLALVFTASLGMLAFQLSFPASDILVVVDGSVPEANFFRAHAKRGTEVVVLDPSKDGISQITDILSERRGLRSLQVVSHGDDGGILLGNTAFIENTLSDRSAEIASWGIALAQGAQIALFGCDVAASERGERFVSRLSDLTGVQVVASTDSTGAAGDWDLEYATPGKPLIAAFGDLSSYEYTLNHFRYGTMSYTHLSGREVLIKVDVGWTNTHGHIPTNTAIGGVVANKLTLYFGDGTSVNASMRVTSRDTTSNDVQTELVTSSGAGYITGYKKTYTSDGNYTVYWGSGARETATGQTTSDWRNEMTVRVGGSPTNSSPVVAVPPVVQVQDNTIFTYSLVAVDPNGDEVRFRWGTQDEFYDNGSSSQITPPTGMTLSSTGALRWDVRNETISTSAGARWQGTVMVEDLSATGAVKSKVPIDFVFIITNNAPPQFVSYPTGTQVAPDGETTSVTLTGTDPNWQTGYASPTITALNPPSTDVDVWTGALLKSGSGASYDVDFTPTEDMAGQTFVVIFRLTNSSGATAVQPVTFLVPGDNQAPSNITISNDDIVEHSPTGSVIGTFTVSDIDPGDTHVLALTGATNTDIFTLGGASGNQLRIASASEAGSGTYTVTVRATDSGSLFLDKNFTIKLWLDEDEDLIADYEDALIGDRTYPNATGVSSLSVRVGGTTASGTYTGSQATVFMDGDDELFSFIPDYDNNTVRLANIMVKRGTNSLVVNAGSEIPAGVKKTMYLEDNNFVSLCVKDAAISSEDEISAACDDYDETDFTSCIGVSGTGVTIGGITCVDEGSRFVISNLTHSGIVGVPAQTGGGSGGSDGLSGEGSGGGSRRGLTAPSGYVLSQMRSAAGGDDAASQPNCSLKGLFTDVPESAWYALHVCILKAAGVVSGYKDASGREIGVYRPENNVSYAELAKMALLVSDQKPASATPANLSARGDWSAPYVRAMEELGISVFSRDLEVREHAMRLDVVSVLFALFDVPLITHSSSPFRDLPLSMPGADIILTAVDLGIMQGDTVSDGSSAGTIRPLSPVNRAETAKIFHRFLQYLESR